MITMDTVIDMLSQYGQLYIKGEHIQMRCPLCGDSKKSKLKKRFNVTYDNGCAFYSCFNCGASGTFAELISELKGIQISEAIRLVETVEFKDIAKKLTKTNKKVEVVKSDEHDFNKILEDCIGVDTEVTGYISKKYKQTLLDFIGKRNVPSEYNVFIAFKGEYKNRIILPIYNNNKIVYFQGRSIFDNDYLKFKNPETEKTGIIMNKEYFQKDKFIIVTEGILDAMMIEQHQGTPVLGGSISDELLGELFKYTDKGIIIASDNDERGDKERKKLIESSDYGKLLRYYIPPLKYKDINKMKIEEKTQGMYDLIVRDCIDYWTLLIKSSI